MSSDILLFNLLRRFKRRWSKEGMAALTQEEVDEANAVIKDWKRAQSGAGLAETGLQATTARLDVSAGLGDAAAFYARLGGSLGPLKQMQVDGINVLLDAMGSAGWPISHVAYALATAYHETAHTMQPIKEIGGEAYFKRMYDIEGERPRKARELGNLTPGDGAKYCGRGYVQLTGRTNYLKAGQNLGMDLVEKPDLAMNPAAAAKILTWGMRSGAFTGKRLSDYLPPLGTATQSQFREARRIINGLDRADHIAAFAFGFQSALVAGGWK